MSDQLIITLGREFGSGGHAIAEELSRRLGITLYDHNLLDAVAAEMNVDVSELRKYDEKPRRLFLSRNENGFSSSAEENVAFLQFHYLKERAEAGESFIVVGRCAESVLRDYPNKISILCWEIRSRSARGLWRSISFLKRKHSLRWSAMTGTESSTTTISARINGAIPEPMT